MIIAAAVTPFNENLSVDKEAFGLLIKHLLGEGLSAVLLFGTTGEAASISFKERIETLGGLAANDFDKEKIWVGTGLTSFKETIELTNITLSLGFSNLLLLPPYYYKNVSDDGLYDYFVRVFDKINCARVKIYFYHFPRMTAVPFSVNLIKRLFKEFKCVRGMKDSQAEEESLGNFVRINKRFEVFAGNEKRFLWHLKQSGAGVISATFNVSAKFARGVLEELHTQGEQALVKEEELIKIRNVIEKFPVIPAVKFLLSLKLNNPNLELVRPPLVKLTSEQKKELIKLLRKTSYRFEN